MIVTHNIDYIQISTHPDLVREMLTENIREAKPVQNYREALRCDSGVHASFGHNNSSNALLVLSGKPLDKMRNAGMSVSEWLNMTYSEHKTTACSRIDIALTWYPKVTHTPYRVSDFIRDALTFGIESKYENKFKTITSVNMKSTNISHNVETAYLGDMKRRGKRGIVRIYDKGLESGYVSDFVTRFELEDRKKSADVTSRRIARNADVLGALASRFKMNAPMWSYLTSNSVPDNTRQADDDVETYDEKRRRRWLWLQRVAITLGEQIAIDEILEYDDHMRDTFIATMWKAYEDKIKQGIDKL